MNRILDLQKLEEQVDEMEALAAGSTSSVLGGCNCSTSSGSACPVCPKVFDI